MSMFEGKSFKLVQRHDHFCITRVSDHLPCICLVVTNHKLLLFLQSLNNQAGEHLDSGKSSEIGTIDNWVDCVN